MSSENHDSADLAIVQDQVKTSDKRWEQEVVPYLPEELEEYAWRLGAMQRKRGKLFKATDLLRGILAYILCTTSFKDASVLGSESRCSRYGRYKLARAYSKSR